MSIKDRILESAKEPILINELYRVLNMSPSHLVEGIPLKFIITDLLITKELEHSNGKLVTKTRMPIESFVAALDALPAAAKQSSVKSMDTRVTTIDVPSTASTNAKMPINSASNLFRVDEILRQFEQSYDQDPKRTTQQLARVVYQLRGVVFKQDKFIKALQESITAYAVQ